MRLLGWAHDRARLSPTSKCAGSSAAYRSRSGRSVGFRGNQEAFERHFTYLWTIGGGFDAVLMLLRRVSSR